MITNFMPDYDLGVVGAWQDYPLITNIGIIPDLIRPTLFIMDCTGIDVYTTDPADMPIIAAHQILGFKYVFSSRDNNPMRKYYRGYKYLDFGTFYDRDSYFMLVYVTKE